MTTIQNTQTTVKRRRRMAREPMDKSAATPIDIASPTPIAPARATTKSALLVDLLSRTEGATISQIVEATGWLSHTVRAALTGLKKKGHALTSDKPEGYERVYSVTSLVLIVDDAVKA